jgi:hypothetical protein
MGMTLARHGEKANRVDRNLAKSVQIHAVARFSSSIFERAEFSLASAGKEFSKILIGS